MGLIYTIYEIVVETIGTKAQEFANKQLHWIRNNKRVDQMQGLGTLDSFA